MDQNFLYQRFFSESTAGYRTMQAFFFRFKNRLVKAQFESLNDLINEVFLSVSKINLDMVQNHEHYIVRSIKLRCWSILEKSNKYQTSGDSSVSADDVEGHATNPWEHLEYNETVRLISEFKLQQSPSDAAIINELIDDPDISSADLGEKLNMNPNTVRTKIHRIRKSLSGYLESQQTILKQSINRKGL